MVERPQFITDRRLLWTAVAVVNNPALANDLLDPTKAPQILTEMLNCLSTEQQNTLFSILGNVTTPKELIDTLITQNHFTREELERSASTPPFLRAYIQGEEGAIDISLLERNYGNEVKTPPPTPSSDNNSWKTWTHG